MPRGEKIGSAALFPVVVHVQNNAALLDGYIFTAPPGSLYELIGISEVHDVAGSDGSAVSLDIKRCASGTTVASGTSVLASTFDMKSTADTPVHKSVSNGGIHQTADRRYIDAGQSLAADFTGTLTALAGVAITLWLKPLRRPTL